MMKPSECLEARVRDLVEVYTRTPSEAQWQALKEWLDQDKADQSGKSCPVEPYAPSAACVCGHRFDGHVIDGYCLGCKGCPGFRYFVVGDSQFADPAVDVCFCGARESEHNEASTHPFTRAFNIAECCDALQKKNAELRMELAKAWNQLSLVAEEVNQLVERNAELEKTTNSALDANGLLLQVKEDLRNDREKLLKANREYSERVRSLESDVLDWKDKAKAWDGRAAELIAALRGWTDDVS